MFFIVLFCVFLIFIGFQLGKSESQQTVIELQNQKINYAQLNDKYNLLNKSFNDLNLSDNLRNEKEAGIKLAIKSFFDFWMFGEGNQNDFIETNPQIINEYFEK